MKKKIIKGVAFLLVFATCFFTVQAIFSGDGDDRDYRRIKSFFEQEENSLDAVFLGSSATYTFWQAPVAWNEYGITVFPLSNVKQPLLAAKFMIDDARKKQPDALYIVNIATVTEEYNFRIHRSIDGYPNTINKFKMIDYLCDLGDFSLSERMEFYFPIIRFHSRWGELVPSDFNTPDDKHKGAVSNSLFMKGVEDVSGGIKDTDYYEPVSEQMAEGITDLMDYCEEEKVRVLFVVTPQEITDKTRIGNLNTVIKMLEDRNFDVLNLMVDSEKIGLDPTKDYFNSTHTNIHGSIKFTDYFARYLAENYGFEDKRGNESFSDWDVASEDYYKTISKFMTDKDYEIITKPEKK